MIMKPNRYPILLLAVPVFILLAAASPAPETSADHPNPQPTMAPTTILWSFDREKPGSLPAGWKVEATGVQDPLATWSILKDPKSASDNGILALTSTIHGSGGTFNLCWTDSLDFLAGEISVRFRAETGREDQGGGIVWRVRDHDNYYIARFNPLEDNFRFYTVHRGNRHQLASARVSLRPGWHTIRIVQRGNHFTGYLDGKQYLSATDDLFPTPGGTGLWTKADAVTSFDDFTVVLYPSTPDEGGR